MNKRSTPQRTTTASNDNLTSHSERLSPHRARPASKTKRTFETDIREEGNKTRSLYLAKRHVEKQNGTLYDCKLVRTSLSLQHQLSPARCTVDTKACCGVRQSDAWDRRGDAGGVEGGVSGGVGGGVGRGVGGGVGRGVGHGVDMMSLSVAALYFRGR
ncbi:uncharacterized protein BO97DRAFT_11620 [Aspergillus homomorphus CBS 101889]|uniref:Uncharacterized protein n=1 Tax=Aspergillus homomorphus (strain CBS 101889) TaxID=1450537 RepID=A0A395IBS7_ASPHC|nr:hypothetical protein BO97DRAFT_11620 [Aspergillus homomorphus CBS 101889]RAL17662.1 hypothetical protein BO97DRAFT_11620 [Aspergillus homomorphus CBS 101889]